jgi:hypothetical protein
MLISQHGLASRWKALQKSTKQRLPEFDLVNLEVIDDVPILECILNHWRQLLLVANEDPSLRPDHRHQCLSGRGL